MSDPDTATLIERLSNEARRLHPNPDGFAYHPQAHLISLAAAALSRLQGERESDHYYRLYTLCEGEKARAIAERDAAAKERDEWKAIAQGWNAAAIDARAILGGDTNPVAMREGIRMSAIKEYADMKGRAEAAAAALSRLQGEQEQMNANRVANEKRCARVAERADDNLHRAESAERLVSEQAARIEALETALRELVRLNDMPPEEMTANYRDFLIAREAAFANARAALASLDTKP